MNDKVRPNPVRRMNEQGWRPPDNGMQYKPASKKTNLGNYSAISSNRQIKTPVKKMAGGMDSFQSSSSSSRPIKTFNKTHRG